MSERVIPKEQLSAYQRWELSDLGRPPEPEEEAPQEAAGPVPEVTLPTAEELERIHNEAWQEGYAAGRSEGLAAGEEASKRMAGLLEEVGASLAKLDQELERDVLALALEISQQIIRQALNVRPELMLQVVREAIASLPQSNQHITLVLNPEDAALVRSDFELEPPAQHWRIKEDAQLERGGVRVETAHSEIDAGLGARWQRLVSALGRDDVRL